MKVRKLLISHDNKCIVVSESIENGRVYGVLFSSTSPHGMEDEWYLDHFSELDFSELKLYER